MGEYLYTVVCAAVCTAVMISLSPDGESGNMGKYVAFAGAVVMALVMLAPLSEFLENVSGFEIKTEVIEKEGSKREGEYYAESAGTVLSSLYGAERSKITARITEGEDGELLKITMIVKDLSLDKEEASKLLSDIYGIKIEIEEG